MDQKRQAFSLSTEHKDAIFALSIEERGILITMIFSYVRRGSIDESIKSTHDVDIIFNVIRAQLDRQLKK